jgi:fatty-acyl-CoA synthase
MVPRATIGAAMAHRARQEPQAVAAYVHEDDGAPVRLTVEDLWTASATVAGELASAGVTAGDSVALCADTSADLLAALFGGMLLGAVPFIVEPPLTEGRGTMWAERFRHMVRVARPRAAFAGGRSAPVVAKVCADLGLPVLTGPFTGEAGTAAAPGVVRRLPHQVSPDAPAYLQFTSGTTGDAKAVVITHRQLFANVAAIGDHVPYLRGDLMVGWLPLHHDMGLVGSLFSTFLHGIPVALMPPLAFAFRPERWPQAISLYRGTLSPAPNFAYHLCASRTTEAVLAELDLSSWRVAFNGAEAVGSQTLRLWQERMGPRGFAPEAMQPCYGMAEVGIAITLSQPGRPPRVLHADRTALAGSGAVVPVAPGHPDAQEITAVGRPLPGYEVLVVDDAGRPLPEYRQGRLVISGPSLTDGYLTADGVADPAPRDGRLDIGDLGFFADGDLFVTGRVKDLIIIAGRNYLPYTMEAAATEVTGVRRGGVAAVGVPHPVKGTESLVVVAESAAAHTPEEAAALAALVEKAVAARTGLRPDRVLVVRRGTLPKTPSGKLQRARIAGLVAAGELAEA